MRLLSHPQNTRPAAKTDGHPSASHRGILRVHGWTGALMVSAFLLSGLWTLALAVVQLAPSQVANTLMDTAELDFGDFWTLQRANDALAIPATVLLVAIALGYFALVMKMLQLSGSTGVCGCWGARKTNVHPGSERMQSSASVVPENRVCSTVHKSFAGEANAPETFVAQDQLTVRLRLRQSLQRGIAILLRYQDTPAFALPKLLLQTSILFKYLREGFPQTTIFFYASLLFLNWLISAYCAMAQAVDPRSALVRIFYSFDLFFAVYAPIQAIVYAYTHFTFDSALFATRTEILPPGNFEVIARLFADPMEISLFRAAFRSLQLSTVWSLVVKITLNGLTIRKWWRTIDLLGETTAQPPPATSPHHLSRAQAVLFFSVGVSVLIYTVVAVVSSTIACKHFDQCKVPSYRWNVGALECSCSVFVDRHTVVQTYAEWEDPIDTSANLGRLAASGDLRVVQIVNRQLPTLPDELRRCSSLEQLILLFTKIITIPEWANEFTNLEYFHIEGDFTDKQLQSLPRDVFANTPKLAFLHLGCLPRIPFVPDLDDVPQLKYLMLAFLHVVTEFPSFDKLLRLERLNIIDAIQVQALPPIGSLHKLTSLVIAGCNAVCCNGFMSGVCDASNGDCLGKDGRPFYDCATQRIDASDLALVDAVGFPVCQGSQVRDVADVRATRESSDDACGGVMYKRCTWRGIEGMCFATRWMVINCETITAYQAIRRLEIERNVGEPCDPDVEAWLGCHAH